MAHRATPPSSSHYWVTLNLTLLHPPPPTLKLPKEMSRPCTHTQTYTRAHTHPVTADHGNINLEIFRQGLSAGVALALGSKLFGDPRFGGRRDLRLGKKGPEVLGGRIKKITQSRMDAMHSHVSPTLLSQHEETILSLFRPRTKSLFLSPKSPFPEGHTATASSLHPQSGYPPRDSPKPRHTRNPGNRV